MTSEMRRRWRHVGNRSAKFQDQCGPPTIYGSGVMVEICVPYRRLHDGHYCEVCHKEFSTSSRLRDHMSMHSESNPFTCSICNRKFTKRSSLTQHYRYHRDHRSFKCSFCSKCFNCNYACAVHERLHTGHNPFPCTVPGCEKAYPQKIQLKLHLCSQRV
ncbi:gastrula zinc finger protein XlCGF49.1-like [Mya arenaria]|uniref:gastrula zinc finger protein XlCGF49.1-like n=1 Tax=Mya arenaria TaxID=6604 RepID=UPI0022E4ADA8|nr:gastrula zinc finger protein XlCGF49.1-like [Mya arenaria]